MNDGLPLVSIVTPVYNGAKFIEDLILSVKSQDYPNIEHIIVDDGSTDDNATVEVLKKYPHLRWWTRPNQGQYATMNEGLAAARGEFVCFVSADDIILPGAVKTAVDFLMSNPRLDGMFGMTGYMDEQGSFKYAPSLFPTAPFRFIGYFAHVSHCSFYIKRQVLIEGDMSFDQSLRYSGDYEWMVRLTQSSIRIGVFPKKLSAVRIHASQTSQLNGDAALMEIDTVYKQHGINIYMRRLALKVYYFQYRFWEVAQKYKYGGKKAVYMYLAKFLKRILNNILQRG